MVTKNDDPNIVVLDRRTYDRLLWLAELGADRRVTDKSFKQLQRNIRQRNSSLRQEHQRQIDYEESILRTERKQVRDVLKSHTGKEVFILRQDNVFERVKLLGLPLKGDGNPNTRKSRVRVKGTEGAFCTHISLIVKELPGPYLTGAKDGLIYLI